MYTASKYSRENNIIDGVVSNRKKTRSQIFKIALAQIFKKKIALIFDMISCEKEEVRNLKKTEGKYHKSCENLFCHCMPMCITQIGSTQNYCVSQDEEDHV